MFLALTSRDSGDIVSASLRRLGAQDANMIILDVADLVGAASLDFAEDGCSNFSLNVAGGVDKVFQVKSCINRALMSNQALAHSENSPRILQTELEYMLRNGINKIPLVSARAGMYGLCGDYLPLYLQWNRVKKILPECTVPRYEYAFGSVAPEVGGFIAPIYKNVFDFRTWKTNAPPTSHWHTFVVDRPPGQPVVAVVVGEKVFFSVPLDATLQPRLEQQSILIARCFGSEFGEILYFIDADTVCFAAHSHVIKYEVTPPSLDQAVAAVTRGYASAH